MNRNPKGRIRGAPHEGEAAVDSECGPRVVDASTHPSVSGGQSTEAPMASLARSGTASPHFGQHRACVRLPKVTRSCHRDPVIAMNLCLPSQGQHAAMVADANPCRWRRSTQWATTLANLEWFGGQAGIHNPRPCQKAPERRPAERSSDCALSPESGFMTHAMARRFDSLRHAAGLAA
jgi:hypothetical protein